MSLIYWVGNTKTDVELVLPKHDILSHKIEKLEINEIEYTFPILELLSNLSYTFSHFPSLACLNFCLCFFKLSLFSQFSAMREIYY